MKSVIDRRMRTTKQYPFLGEKLKRIILAAEIRNEMAREKGTPVNQPFIRKQGATR